MGIFSIVQNVGRMVRGERPYNLFIMDGPKAISHCCYDQNPMGPIPKVGERVRADLFTLGSTGTMSFEVTQIREDIPGIPVVFADWETREEVSRASEMQYASK